jgi:hypothetical protein
VQAKEIQRANGTANLATVPQAADLCADECTLHDLQLQANAAILLAAIELSNTSKFPALHRQAASGRHEDL